jgi:hypothetical protein
LATSTMFLAFRSMWCRGSACIRLCVPLGLVGCDRGASHSNTTQHAHTHAAAFVFHCRRHRTTPDSQLPKLGFCVFVDASDNASPCPRRMS